MHNNIQSYRRVSAPQADPETGTEYEMLADEDGHVRGYDFRGVAV